MVAEAIVDALEVVEVGEHDGQRRPEHLRPLELDLERLDEAAPVDEGGQFVRGRLPAHFVMEPRVLERDPGLGRDPFRELERLSIEAAAARVEDQTRVHFGALTSQLECQRPAPAAGVAEPAHLFAVLDHLGAAGPRRFGDHLQDQRNKGARIVSRGECVADERNRLACVARGRVGPTPFVVPFPERRGFQLTLAQRAKQDQEQNERDQRRGTRKRDQQHVRCGMGRPAVMRS